LAIGENIFNIYLTEEPVPELDPGVRAVYGKIRINDYRETFVASLIFWGAHDYERQWIAALQRLVEGANRSILISSYVEPVSEGFLFCWTLYRVGETVCIQNQMLFFDQLSGPFNVESPWDSVGKRESFNAEGLKISEWTTTVNSIHGCLNRKLQAAPRYI
jgi:hypothetical protein